MVNKAEIMAKIAELQAQLMEKEVPTLCEGCGAHLQGNPKCEYCGRFAEMAIPDEPPDIRKTNASDDICPMCQTVHTKDAYQPVICRCQKCGNLGVVALSTYDPILGYGVVCRTCCGQAAPANLQQLEAEALARAGLMQQSNKMPWH